jgi:cytochrome c oxidase subunit 2
MRGAVGAINGLGRKLTMNSERAIAATVALLALPGAAIANGESRFGLQTPQTPVAHVLYDLHSIILGICILIAVVVFGFMFYAIVRHRRSLGHQAKQFDDNVPVQILWTLIPCLIVVGMAFPATRTVIAMKDTSSPDMTIKITGYQWKWHYDYIGQGVSFYSDLATPRDQIENKAPKGEHYLLEVDNPLVVPVGKKVRILLTANDVNHSWWVPAFGVKQDAIPGFVRDSWFQVDTPGVYRGQCTELCGKDHGFMPVVVEALPAEEPGGNRGRQLGRGQDLFAGRVEDRGREGLRPHLRRLPSGERAGIARRISGARPRGHYDRTDRGSHRHRHERQQEEPRHGGLEGPALRPGARRRDHLRTQRLR